MSVPANRPRVFVSSTIHDLRDLRSALKFWLEELGRDVLMSEFNDFVRRPDEGTFQSCFQAIADSHYFVLLIGSRKGSLYTADVSVTQQEYRVAARLAQERRIAPVVFVRTDVLSALNDRRDIKNALPWLDIDATGSRILEDPAFTRRFLQEVRNTELGRRGEDPSGSMWTYSFDSFRDVSDALRVCLRVYGSVNRSALLANLEAELRDNIAVFCENRDGSPYCGYRHIDRVAAKIAFELAGPVRPINLLEADSAELIAFLTVGMPLEAGIRTDALQDAISSGEFLWFNPATEKHVRSPELDAMIDLRRDLGRYRALSKWAQSRLADWDTQWQTKRSLTVDSLTLGIIFGAADLTKNIMRRSFSLLDFIADPSDAFTSPELIDSSPFGGKLRQKVREAEASHELVEAWRLNPASREAITRA